MTPVEQYLQVTGDLPGDSTAADEWRAMCADMRGPMPATLPGDKGIGDVTSDARGSGARFNGGKPDYSLVPLRLLAASHADTSSPIPALGALYKLGDFQASGDTDALFDAIDLLGRDEGWAECARVFEYGKRRKYAAWNWAKGMPWSVPIACAARHLLAMLAGEDTDPESGLPHRGHIFCNFAMLLTYEQTYSEGNDLPPAGLL